MDLSRPGPHPGPDRRPPPLPLPADLPGDRPRRGSRPVRRPPPRVLGPRGIGEKVALRQGDRQWTYTQLADQVARVSGALRALRIVRGERVAILMRDTLEAASSILGIIHAGGVAAPLSELSTA